MGELEVFLSEGCGSSSFNSMKCFPSGANSPKFPGFGYRDGSLKMLSSVSTSVELIEVLFGSFSVDWAKLVVLQKKLKAQIPTPNNPFFILMYC
jgi:hypothetical protein